MVEILRYSNLALDAWMNAWAAFIKDANSALHESVYRKLRLLFDRDVLVNVYMIALSFRLVPTALIFFFTSYFQIA